jgi:hypothetical protein
MVCKGRREKPLPRRSVWVENAPINKDAVNQNESRAAALRASSISCFAVSMTSVTLFSASAWLIPVRDATTRAT